MKRKYLFFILITSTLTVSIMAGQRIDDVNKNELPKPFKDFVSRCRDHKLSERVNEYRAKMDTLERGKFDKVSHNSDEYFFDLISQIAKQGDFESLEMLEKDLPPDWKQEFWEAIAVNDNMDGPKKLLVKWAIGNPTVPMLMKYHANGLNQLIEMAEDKNANGNHRVDCLEILASMPAATKVLDRIKALISDQSGFFKINELRFDPGIPYSNPKTVGDIAAKTVATIEAVKKLQKK